MKKLIFINTHPIQYFGPLYAHIDKENYFDLEVWYCSMHGLNSEYDPEFNQKIKWDIPILNGYRSIFLKNFSFNPGIFNGFFGLMNFGILWRLFLIPKGSVIIIHGWSYFTALLTMVFGRLIGHQICLRAESPLIHESSRTKISKHLRTLVFKWLLFRIPHKFLYIGTENYKFYRYFGVRENKLIFTPYCVNNEDFYQKSMMLDKFKKLNREKLAIPEDAFVILYSGKLIGKKRPMDLIRAYKDLKSRESIYLLFVGDGIEKNRLEEFKNAHNLNNVILTGFVNQSEIAQFYSLADLYVMCSDYGETWGLSTNEAMNFSIPILVSNRTGCSVDLVKGNGYIFNTGDVHDLVDKIRILTQKDGKELNDMGLRSRKIVSEYSYTRISENLKTSFS